MTTEIDPKKLRFRLPRKKRGPTRNRDVELQVALARLTENKGFEEIGDDLGISRQRATQIYQRYINGIFGYANPEWSAKERKAVMTDIVKRVQQDREAKTIVGAMHG
jgi:hypothetical protein